MPTKPDLIQCLDWPEYNALYTLMFQAGAPVTYSTLRDIMDAAWVLSGQAVDNARYQTFVAVYRITFSEVVIGEETFEVASAAGVSFEFWERFVAGFNTPSDVECGCKRGRFPPVSVLPPLPCK